MTTKETVVAQMEAFCDKIIYDDSLRELEVLIRSWAEKITKLKVEEQETLTTISDAINSARLER